MSVVISYLILLSPHPPIGIVAGITLPPLLFLNYLGLSEGSSDFDLAWKRFVDITIGIVAAMLVGSVVWSNHARVRYFRSVAKTFERATDYCESVNEMHAYDRSQHEQGLVARVVGVS